jgi:hypothetical protein
MLLGVLTRERHEERYGGSFTVAAQSRNATEFSRIQLQQLSIRDVKRDMFDRVSLFMMVNLTYNLS